MLCCAAMNPYDSAPHPKPVDHEAEPLTAVERAVWNDPAQLGRIEAVLDDPSLAVPLEDLD